MAINASEEYGYFGSWNKKQIVKINLDNKKMEVLQTPFDGRLNGMGTYIRNGKLYALMNEVNDSVNAAPISVLLVFDLESDKLIKTYQLAGDSNGRHHFNHVVVDKNGKAYISDTLKESIYIVATDDQEDKLRLLIKDKALSMVHGIIYLLMEASCFVRAIQVE